MWYVYILECKNKSLYTGVTTDLKRRIAEHRKGTGAAFTRSFKVRRVRYSERYRTRGKALQREYAIKQLAREEKLILINKQDKQDSK